MTAIAVGVAVTLVLGVAPQYFLDLASQAGVFVREPLLTPTQGTQRPEPRLGRGHHDGARARPEQFPAPPFPRTQGPRPWTPPWQGHNSSPSGD